MLFTPHLGHYLIYSVQDLLVSHFVSLSSTQEFLAPISSNFHD